MRRPMPMTIWIGETHKLKDRISACGCSQDRNHSHMNVGGEQIQPRSISGNHCSYLHQCQEVVWEWLESQLPVRRCVDYGLYPKVVETFGIYSQWSTMEWAQEYMWMALALTPVLIANPLDILTVGALSTPKIWKSERRTLHIMVSHLWRRLLPVQHEVRIFLLDWRPLRRSQLSHRMIQVVELPCMINRANASPIPYPRPWGAEVNPSAALSAGVAL